MIAQKAACALDRFFGQRFGIPIERLKMGVCRQTHPQERQRQRRILFQPDHRRDLLLLCRGIRQQQLDRQRALHQPCHDPGDDRHQQQKAQHHHADLSVHIQHEHDRDPDRAEITDRHRPVSIGTGTAASTPATTLRASPCWDFPFGERIRRCARTLSAMSLTSSGSTYSLPERTAFAFAAL